jgi:hypothetical protein
MLVQAGGMHVLVSGVIPLHPNDVGTELTVSRVLDAKIAVFQKLAQPVLVHAVLGIAHREFLLFLAHDPFSSLSRGSSARTRSQYPAVAIA